MYLFYLLPGHNQTLAGLGLAMPLSQERDQALNDFLCFGSSHMESLGTRLISTTRSMNLTSLKSDVSSSSSLNHLH